MLNHDQNNQASMLCHEFEVILSDYLDDALDKQTRRRASEHALQCPLCHALLNAVKTTISDCRAAVETLPAPSLELDARILQMTMPETAMSCEEFENLLTDYLDGFLPAHLFHRWERHATLCGHCTNLPGAVVRSIGACITYKAEELPVPVGLNAKILEATLGTAKAETVRMPVWKSVWQALENAFQPVFAPVFTAQFASVAMMLLLAFAIFANADSTNNSISGVYQTGAQLAAHTYEQSAGAVETGIAKGLNFGEQPAANGDTEQK